MTRQPPRAPEQAQVFDPGLQQERNYLAWTRTASSLMLAGAVQLRVAALSGGGLLFLAGIAFLAGGAALLGLASRNYVSLHAVLRAREPVANALMRVTAAFVIAFGLVSAGLVALGAIGVS